MRKADETPHFFFGSLNIFKIREHFCSAYSHYFQGRFRYMKTAPTKVRAEVCII